VRGPIDAGIPILLVALLWVSGAGARAGTNEVASGTSSSRQAKSEAARRPANWAVKLDRPGLPNLYQVTPTLYRGAQPGSQGMAELRALGIRTVVNLREFHSDSGKLTADDLQRARLKMEPWHASDEEVVRFLRIVTQTNNLPVFVHCQRGADRTGTMCAMYRIVVCGWTREEAVREMTDGGFGFNPAWRNLVRYVRTADIEKLKREAGLLQAPERNVSVQPTNAQRR
jgi:tyrosine-protein phosphatase SIW14